LRKKLDIKMPVVVPAKRLSKIASRAGMSEKAQRRALELLTEPSRGG
jgi:hypothetical protein